MTSSTGSGATDKCDEAETRHPVLATVLMGILRAIDEDSPRPSPSSDRDRCVYHDEEPTRASCQHRGQVKEMLREEDGAPVGRMFDEDRRLSSGCPISSGAQSPVLHTIEEMEGEESDRLRKDWTSDGGADEMTGSWIAAGHHGTDHNAERDTKSHRGPDRKTVHREAKYFKATSSTSSPLVTSDDADIADLLSKHEYEQLFGPDRSSSNRFLIPRRFIDRELLPLSQRKEADDKSMSPNRVMTPTKYHINLSPSSRAKRKLDSYLKDTSLGPEWIAEDSIQDYVSNVEIYVAATDASETNRLNEEDSINGRYEYSRSEQFLSENQTDRKRQKTSGKRDPTSQKYPPSLASNFRPDDVEEESSDSSLMEIKRATTVGRKKKRITKPARLSKKEPSNSEPRSDISSDGVVPDYANITNAVRLDIPWTDAQKALPYSKPNPQDVADEGMSSLFMEPEGKEHQCDVDYGLPKVASPAFKTIDSRSTREKLPIHDISETKYEFSNSTDTQTTESRISRMTFVPGPESEGVAIVDAKEPTEKFSSPTTEWLTNPERLSRKEPSDSEPRSDISSNGLVPDHADIANSAKLDKYRTGAQVASPYSKPNPQDVADEGMGSLFKELEGKEHQGDVYYGLPEVPSSGFKDLDSSSAREKIPIHDISETKYEFSDSTDTQTTESRISRMTCERGQESEGIAMVDAKEPQNMYSSPTTKAFSVASEPKSFLEKRKYECGEEENDSETDIISALMEFISIKGVKQMQTKLNSRDSEDGGSSYSLEDIQQPYKPHLLTSVTKNIILGPSKYSSREAFPSLTSASPIKNVGSDHMDDKHSSCTADIDFVSPKDDSKQLVIGASTEEITKHLLSSSPNESPSVASVSRYAHSPDQGTTDTEGLLSMDLSAEKLQYQLSDKQKYTSDKAEAYSSTFASNKTDERAENERFDSVKHVQSAGIEKRESCEDCGNIKFIDSRSLARRIPSPEVHDIYSTTSLGGLPIVDEYQRHSPLMSFNSPMMLAVGGNSSSNASNQLQTGDENTSNSSHARQVFQPSSSVGSTSQVTSSVGVGILTATDTNTSGESSEALAVGYHRKSQYEGQPDSFAMKERKELMKYYKSTGVSTESAEQTRFLVTGRNLEEIKSAGYRKLSTTDSRSQKGQNMQSCVLGKVNLTEALWREEPVIVSDDNDSESETSTETEFDTFARHEKHHYREQTHDAQNNTSIKEPTEVSTELAEQTCCTLTGRNQDEIESVGYNKSSTLDSRPQKDQNMQSFVLGKVNLTDALGSEQPVIISDDKDYGSASSYDVQNTSIKETTELSTELLENSNFQVGLENQEDANLEQAETRLQTEGCNIFEHCIDSEDNAQSGICEWSTLGNLGSHIQEGQIMQEYVTSKPSLTDAVWKKEGINVGDGDEYESATSSAGADFDVSTDYGTHPSIEHVRDERVHIPVKESSAERDVHPSFHLDAESPEAATFVYLASGPLGNMANESHLNHIVHNRVLSKVNLADTLQREEPVFGDNDFQGFTSSTDSDDCYGEEHGMPYQEDHVDDRRDNISVLESLKISRNHDKFTSPLSTRDNQEEQSISSQMQHNSKLLPTSFKSVNQVKNCVSPTKCEELDIEMSNFEGISICSQTKTKEDYFVLNVKRFNISESSNENERGTKLSKVLPAYTENGNRDDFIGNGGPAEEYRRRNRSLLSSENEHQSHNTNVKMMEENSSDIAYQCHFAADANLPPTRFLNITAEHSTLLELDINTDVPDVKDNYITVARVLDCHGWRNGQTSKKGDPHELFVQSMCLVGEIVMKAVATVYIERVVNIALGRMGLIEQALSVRMEKTLFPRLREDRKQATRHSYDLWTSPQRFKPKQLFTATSSHPCDLTPDIGMEARQLEVEEREFTASLERVLFPSLEMSPESLINNFGLDETSAGLNSSSSSETSHHDMFVIPSASEPTSNRTNHAKNEAENTEALFLTTWPVSLDTFYLRASQLSALPSVVLNQAWNMLNGLCGAVCSFVRCISQSLPTDERVMQDGSTQTYGDYTDHGTEPIEASTFQADIFASVVADRIDTEQENEIVILFIEDIIRQKIASEIVAQATKRAISDVEDIKCEFGVSSSLHRSVVGDRFEREQERESIRLFIEDIIRQKLASEIVAQTITRAISCVEDMKCELGASNSLHRSGSENGPRDAASDRSNTISDIDDLSPEYSLTDLPLESISFMRSLLADMRDIASSVSKQPELDAQQHSTTTEASSISVVEAPKETVQSELITNETVSTADISVVGREDNNNEMKADSVLDNPHCDEVKHTIQTKREHSSCARIEHISPDAISSRYEGSSSERVDDTGSAFVSPEEMKESEYQGSISSSVCSSALSVSDVSNSGISYIRDQLANVKLLTNSIMDDCTSYAEERLSLRKMGNRSTKNNSAATSEDTLGNDRTNNSASLPSDEQANPGSLRDHDEDDKGYNGHKIDSKHNFKHVVLVHQGEDILQQDFRSGERDTMMVEPENLWGMNAERRGEPSNQFSKSRHGNVGNYLSQHNDNITITNVKLVVNQQRNNNFKEDDQADDAGSTSVRTKTNGNDHSSIDSDFMEDVSKSVHWRKSTNEVQGTGQRGNSGEDANNFGKITISSQTSVNEEPRLDNKVSKHFLGQCHVMSKDFNIPNISTSTSKESGGTSEILVPVSNMSPMNNNRYSESKRITVESNSKGTGKTDISCRISEKGIWINTAFMQGMQGNGKQDTTDKQLEHENNIKIDLNVPPVGKRRKHRHRATASHITSIGTKTRNQTTPNLGGGSNGYSDKPEASNTHSPEKGIMEDVTSKQQALREVTRNEAIVNISVNADSFRVTEDRAGKRLSHGEESEGITDDSDVLNMLDDRALTRLENIRDEAAAREDCETNLHLPPFKISSKNKRRVTKILKKMTPRKKADTDNEDARRPFSLGTKSDRDCASDEAILVSYRALKDACRTASGAQPTINVDMSVSQSRSEKCLDLEIKKGADSECDHDEDLSAAPVVSSSERTRAVLRTRGDATDSSSFGPTSDDSSMKLDITKANNRSRKKAPFHRNKKHNHPVNDISKIASTESSSLLMESTECTDHREGRSETPKPHSVFSLLNIVLRNLRSKNRKKSKARKESSNASQSSQQGDSRQAFDEIIDDLEEEFFTDDAFPDFVSTDDVKSDEATSLNDLMVDLMEEWTECANNRKGSPETRRTRSASPMFNNFLQSLGRKKRTGKPKAGQVSSTSSNGSRRCGSKQAFDEVVCDLDEEVFTDDAFPELVSTDKAESEEVTSLNDVMVDLYEEWSFDGLQEAVGSSPIITIGDNFRQRLTSVYDGLRAKKREALKYLDAGGSARGNLTI